MDGKQGWRSPLRSLAARLILAFLAVSLVGAALSAGLARWATGRAFDNLVMDQAQADFISDAATYYEVKGAWAGVANSIPPRHLSARRTGGPDPSAGRGISPGQPAGGKAEFSFVLLDENRNVVVPAGRYSVGQHVADGGPAPEMGVVVGGQAVGTVFAAGQPLALNTQEALYVTRMDRALLYAALIGAGLALVLGALLARTLVRPLGELTAASRAVAQGELGRQVIIRSRDELGELAETFNRMSTGLASARELRQQMTADIAHELRSPLTVIIGYLEGLRDGVLKPNQERFEVMYGEARQLQRLVEDLRTLSLADAGELPLARRPVRANALLEQTAAAFEQRARHAGVELRVGGAAHEHGGAPADTDAEVSVDAERMLQVLANLTGNALRHTPPGGQIVLAARSGPGTLELSVQDSGEGIPPDVLPHLFDRFYRGDASRSGQGGESGLGLAIVRSIVEAHGGSVSASSAGPGLGSTFTVQLPA